MTNKINPDWDRIDAIRRMLNAPEGEKIRLSSGEIIRAWDLIDEQGNNVGIEEINTEMLLHCYQRSQQWSCPEEYRDGQL